MENNPLGDLSKINWGVNGHKLLISPKFMEFLNGLQPGPDRGLLVALLDMVHFLNETINKSAPDKMKSSEYQPAIRIQSPIHKHNGKISRAGFKEFIRIGEKYPHIKNGKDYDSLSL